MKTFSPRSYKLVKKSVLVASPKKSFIKFQQNHSDSPIYSFIPETVSTDGVRKDLLEK